MVESEGEEWSRQGFWERIEWGRRCDDCPGGERRYR